MLALPHTNPLPASQQDGTYPRPQLARTSFLDLTGRWDFTFDDENVGLRERWWSAPSFARTIEVPFPPESTASGIGETGFHDVLWYSRTFSQSELDGVRTGAGERVLVHFGAVDYRSTVWVDGHRVGDHEGGHTPFFFDITDALTPDRSDHMIVVRVEDDPQDVAQPRGKQDWREEPHVVWYHRTSGIWQPVWLEAVPSTFVQTLHWCTDIPAQTVAVRVSLNARPRDTVKTIVRLTYEGSVLGEATAYLTERETDVRVSVPALGNGQAYEELIWSPEHPRLVDAELQVGDDTVSSYLGIRSTAVAHGTFLLNDRPYYVRSVLSQGYWPESHLAAPSADALRHEVQVTKDLGFNAARVHQKFEDPRFLYWADKLGLLVWGEAPATFTFTPVSVQRTIHEWLEVVERDFSHPSIVTWVPLNESWGVQHIQHDERMQHFARTLVELTRTLDPTRPVVSNDGWEQVDTDIIAIHDYEGDSEIVGQRYADRDAVDTMIASIGPAGRQLILNGDVSSAPVMLTEFGGISYDADNVTDAWGYTAAGSADEFTQRLTSLLAEVHASQVLAGFCYTQLTDTLQETNGLLRSDRSPKLPIHTLRKIFSGADE
ncbi:glycoside hydrolase family 2 sugar binding protein [Microbacterium laevaniformans OR221]|nr:glycoside hydrolase family 2 sugar binding protein [Microbacterium laevaniformans OR221]